MNTRPKWLAHGLAIVTLSGALSGTLVTVGQQVGYFDSHTKSEADLLRQQKAESDRLKEHYLIHLSDAWASSLAKGTRKIAFSEIDDCLLDQDARWRRVIPPYAASTPPLVAVDYPSFEATIYAAEQGPRMCVFHAREAPFRRDPIRDDGRWILERWTFLDRCWANAWFDRGNPYNGWILDFVAGCPHGADR